jgi:hypothetical protein
MVDITDMKWLISVIPATWETEVGGLWSKTGAKWGGRPYLKSQLKAKGLGYGPRGTAPA